MKTLTILIAFLSCISLSAQKGKLFVSSWHEVGNDGTGITTASYSNFKKGNLYYFLSNDNANVYIDMKIVDPPTQTRILEYGLTIWINMDGKELKKMGIRFPIGSQNSKVRKNSDMGEYNMSKDVNTATLLSLANKIELLGFTSEEVRLFPAGNSDNFRGSLRYDNEGTLYYRMVMPIAKLPVRNSKDGNGAMPFHLGFEYGQSNTLPALSFWIKNFKLVTDK
jgi:hypothetical protein